MKAKDIIEVEKNALNITREIMLKKKKSDNFEMVIDDNHGQIVFKEIFRKLLSKL